jgi:hypothetical protein
VEIGILLVFVYSSTIYIAEFEVLLIKNTRIVRDLVYDTSHS